jgi:hypothetical protein
MQDERAQIAALNQDLREALRDPPAPRPPTKATRALNARIDEVLAKLKATYVASRQDRRKTAIYPYLEAVYAYGLRFEERSQSRYLMEQAARTGGPKARKNDSVFAYLLRATSTANRKTRNTWVEALEIAHSQEDGGCRLTDIFEEAGGLKNYVRQFAGAEDDLEPTDKETEETKQEDDGWGPDEDYEDYELNDQTRMDLQCNVPEAPRVALSEAMTCFDEAAHTATAVMCSLALQRACAAQGIAVGDIRVALSILQERGMIRADSTGQSCEDAARVMEIAYAGQPAVRRKDAGKLLEFTRAVVDALFS